MRQGLVRLILLVIVLLVIFGVYRLLTIDPIDGGPFFDPAARPLVLVEPAGSDDAAPFTLAAFEHVAAGDVSGFYLPVYLTLDGDLVAAPSDDLAQISNGQGKLSELTLDEVQALDAGYLYDPGGDGAFPLRGRGSQFLSLGQLLAAFPDQRFAVELRQPGLQSLAALLQVADGQNARSRLLAVVDDQQLVDTLRQQAPDLATAMTSAETSSYLMLNRLGLAAFYRPVAPGLLLSAEQFRPRVARAAHSGGMSALVTLEPDADDAQAWIEQSADGVIIARSQAPEPE